MKWSNRLFSMALLIIFHHGRYCCQADQSYPSRSVFAKTNGTHFVMNNRPLYLNGFNAFWMMYMSSDPCTRSKVTSAFQQASKHGMNIARTWAFSDGGNDKPLQISPGIYNEDMFEGLDFVVAEARKHGIYLILSLVNNYKDYGGIPQYVEWARERGQQLSDNDEFYTNTAVKEYYKNHVEDWVHEMAAHVKSIDNDHLLEIGLEGFYGDSKKESNPGNYLFGTDFISSNQIPQIDFATIHLYPEQWLLNSSEDEQASFVDRWIEAHIQDSSSVLGKPLIIAEFGWSSRLPGYTQQKRDSYFVKIYSDIYNSVTGGGPFSGGLFWQLMAQGMESWGDGYEVVLGEECPSSTANIIDLQSRKLQSLQESDYS
ncbi:hypothetical protein SADUNF_Sadunf02G0151700 [Salix dunnii]|uniref:mannan endo-1,4-beta-mannosidase n=1 Tax=Salix dunnii TaxID=1413687 RepID=A0A835N816_9ROSI|nr:hypothetical protein SADUNF_Sadunf02G0151700 [Salix dunnii]